MSTRSDFACKNRVTLFPNCTVESEANLLENPRPVRGGKVFVGTDPLGPETNFEKLYDQNNFLSVGHIPAVSGDWAKKFVYVKRGRAPPKEKDCNQDFFLGGDVRGPTLAFERLLAAYLLYCRRIDQLLSESVLLPVVSEMVESDSACHRIAPYTQDQSPKRIPFSCLGLDPAARYASVQNKMREALDKLGNKFLRTYKTYRICRCFNLGTCTEDLQGDNRFKYCGRRGVAFYHVCWCTICHQPGRDCLHKYTAGRCDG